MTQYIGAVPESAKMEVISVSLPGRLDPYTVATLPYGLEGDQILVTDEIGGSVPAFYDGTNWRRVTDRAIVS